MTSTTTKSMSIIKPLIGILTLGIVFTTPYLHITQFCLSMDLFHSALYSLILLGFWVIAAPLLRAHHPTKTTKPALQPDRRHQHHKTPTTTV